MSGNVSGAPMRSSEHQEGRSPDQELVRSNVAGFEEFYREAYPGAVRLVWLLTQDVGAGPDLAQEAFVRVYEKWARVDRPDAYLHVTVVNVCRDWRARRWTERVKLPLVASDPGVNFAFNELADAVAALPERQRMVLVLRYYSGLSEAEIAETLGCRPGTVKSLAARALAQLRKVVER
jgi:RNA polymerase sigma-70 factor (sigma-E family)